MTSLPTIEALRNLIVARAVIGVLNERGRYIMEIPPIPIPPLPRFLASDPRFL